MTKNENHKKVVFWLFLGFGIGIIFFGSGLVIDAHTKGLQNKIAESESMNLTHPVTAEFSQDHITNDPTRSIFVDLSKNEAFSGDQIKYHAYITTTRPQDVKQIILIADSYKRDYTLIKNSYDFEELVKDSKKARQIIEINATSNPPFTDDGILDLPIEEDLYLGGLEFYVNGSSYVNPQKIMHVYPSYSKYQIQTNQAIMQQIQESKKNLVAQNISNENVEGLTWVIVGAIPIEFALVLRTDIWKSIFEKGETKTKKPDESKPKK